MTDRVGSVGITGIPGSEALAAACNSGMPHATGDL